MVTLEQIAAMVLADEPLEARSLVQDFQRRAPVLSEEPCPVEVPPDVLVVAAALAELIAQRTGQAPPQWASRVGPRREPLYLVQAAQRSPKMRERIERESPEPLRARNVYAPPGYLELV